MGDIKKVLAISRLPYRTITPNGIWTDLCEDIHLHFRNVRYDFSADEWAKFRAAIFSCGMQMERSSLEKEWVEGDVNRLIQFTYGDRFSVDSDYFPNRLSIEWQRDNTVHFHYRDLRLHLTADEFLLMASKMAEAVKNMEEYKPVKFDVDGPTRMKVAVKDIQPFDSGHLPGIIDKEHRQGIEFVKAQIQLGKKLRPIIIRPDGQRIDGFKRYMAYKELGHDEIEVIVDPFATVTGGQQQQSLFEDEEGSDV